uniref:RING-type E3 ubiquitin transferase n=1 Tax=Bos indicus x Bos taurus TaxID=30522 RepID=A0A4W2IL53_BOBOX
MDSLAEPRWPPALAVMKKVDDLLRCGICFEYFNIAMMIPQCSHNYCSLCIRKFLSYKTQCPTCCVTVTEPDLKNNRVLDELVKNLNFARNHLLQFALESPPISAASSSSKNLATKADTAVAFRHSLKQGSKLMENFLIRESGGSASELLIKENESKLSPQKKLSSPAKTRGTPSAVKSAPGSSEDSVLETPSTSALKQVTKAAEIVQEIENMEKTRMRFEASKLNESVMVFTKNQTEKEIDEIHSKYRQEDNKIKSSDTPSVETNHFRQSKLDFPGKLERSRQDDSFSCTDIQEEALSSSESDSFKSSSSDIIRDLLEEEEAWEASHKNDFQDREISPGQNRRTRSAESAELEPRNKRNRN